MKSHLEVKESSNYTVLHIFFIGNCHLKLKRKSNERLKIENGLINPKSFCSETRLVVYHSFLIHKRKIAEFRHLLWDEAATSMRKILDLFLLLFFTVDL